MAVAGRLKIALMRLMPAVYSVRRLSSLSLEGTRRLVHRGEVSASVIANADVHVGALLRAAKRRPHSRNPTVVLGRDGRTLSCTPDMMSRSDTVGARCRAVMRCENGGRWTRMRGRRYRCRCAFGFGGPRCAHRAVRCVPGKHLRVLAARLAAYWPAPIHAVALLAHTVVT